MNELLGVLLVSFILVVLSHYTSVYDRNGMGYLRKELLFYAVLAAVLILFAGLRTDYNDTYFYIHSYNLWQVDRSFSGIDWKLGSNPGYCLLTQLLVNSGFGAQSYVMLYAALTLGVYLWFVRKYSKNLWLSLFLFIAGGSFIFAFAAIKQCAAVAFALLGVDCAIRKRWVAFVFWVILGALFHPYALMYLITPLLVFCPWKKQTWWLLGAFGVAGPLLQPLMHVVIRITTLLGEEYTAESFSDVGVNPFRLAVMLVPVLLSFVTRGVIERKNDRTMNIMVNLVMLHAAIMYVALFGTANYFARLANYFLIFQCITIPWLLSNFDRRTRRWLIPLAVVCYAAYFYYENVLTYHFDSLFSRVTLLDWLQSLL